MVRLNGNVTSNKYATKIQTKQADMEIQTNH